MCFLVGIIIIIFGIIKLLWPVLCTKLFPWFSNFYFEFLILFIFHPFSVSVSFQHFSVPEIFFKISETLKEELAEAVRVKQVISSQELTLVVFVSDYQSGCS